ncbi:MAG: hypothetical protein LBM77_12200 [Spirochaetaceae bacterium]|jgi:hypothetical protein|nr:hypothetical protein [Spirochaetaceae bacterium]
MQKEQRESFLNILDTALEKIWERKIEINLARINNCEIALEVLEHELELMVEETILIETNPKKF